MGEAQGIVYTAEFNKAARVEVSPLALTEDPGALYLRDVWEKLGITNRLAGFVDHRDRGRITHPLVEILRSRVFLIAQGWVDQDDADTLRRDPAFRLAVSTRTGERPLLQAEAAREPEGLPSQPTQSRLQSMLAGEYNRREFERAVLRTGIAGMTLVHGRRDTVVLDVDSFADEVHGSQDGAAYNGHYRKTCYHPLIAFTDTGDLVGVRIRPGNVPSARDVRSFLGPIISALQEVCGEVWVRMDAGFADGKLYAWLRKQGVRYLLRLKSNAALGKEVAEWEKAVVASWATPAPDGKPREATREFWYRSGAWTYAERVVAVAIERTAKHGELFHNVFYLVTNLARPQATSRLILDCYRQRGTAEGYIGDFVGTIAPTLSSVARCREGAPPHKRRIAMAENGVSLLLSALAYELMHVTRCLLEKGTGLGFSLRRVRERLLKAATSVVRHARRIHFRICATKEALWRVAAAFLAELGAAQEVPA